MLERARISGMISPKDDDPEARVQEFAIAPAGMRPLWMLVPVALV